MQIEGEVEKVQGNGPTAVCEGKRGKVKGVGEVKEYAEKIIKGINKGSEGNNNKFGANI